VLTVERCRRPRDQNNSRAGVGVISPARMVIFPSTFIGYPQKHAITTRAAKIVVPQISVQIFL
jgi:hypothetical protein